MAFTTSFVVAFWTTPTTNQYLPVNKLYFFSSAEKAAHNAHVALGDKEMFTLQINTAFVVAAVVVHLTITTPTIGDPEAIIDRTIDEIRNQQLVIRNMTGDFRDFGLGREQARMLAEQTADFGTLGMLTTMAAVGIVPLPVNMTSSKNKSCVREV
ncbi:MAG: hypothetical protein WBN68_18970 [Sedimenticolaceae bacterium]